ncbi:MAG TPA: hypothetical protein VFB59_01345 [Candidatus Saccharimonadales bacterium]|nr:hypothetical protein [Candidatus Saccharimonadales bacterium]
MSLFKRSNSITIGGEYFGTHPQLKGYYKQARLVMDDNGIDFYDHKTLVRHFTWAEIIGFDAEQTVQREGRSRLTVTRMLALGPLSLAAPKAAGKVESAFTCILHTTTGDLSLGNNLNGSAGSSMTIMAIEVTRKQGQKVRAFVAARAKAG